MDAALHGAHTYGLPATGIEPDVATLSCDSVRQFHARYYAPNNAVLVLSGDVMSEQIREIAELT